MAILRSTRAAPLSHIISSSSCGWRVTRDLLGKHTTQAVQQPVTLMTGETSQCSWRPPVGELALALDTCGTRFPRGCSGHTSRSILPSWYWPIYTIPRSSCLPCPKTHCSRVYSLLTRYSNSRSYGGRIMYTIWLNLAGPFCTQHTQVSAIPFCMPRERRPERRSLGLLRRLACKVPIGC
jgi:hypothetical protein